MALTGSETGPRRAAGARSPMRAAARGLGDAAYWVFWSTVGTACRLTFRIAAVDRPPLDGPCVLVANHCSYLDPIFLSAVTPRRVTYLMNALVYRTPPFRWFYSWNRAIPVELAGRNVAALRAARAALDAGACLGMFPEGGISRDGMPLLGEPGAVALVLSTGARVVPVGITGSYDVLPPQRSMPRLCRVTVRFGAPIAAADLAPAGAGGRRAHLAAATSRIMDAIAGLCGTVGREAELRGETRAVR
jgi:1-acyl-sn-glycerol-3-phosphate acyltransferase